VPGADDVMLNYQSTSFHDALFVRRLLGLKRAPEFETWLQRMGITDAAGAVLPPPARPALAQALAPWLGDAATPAADGASGP
jgi:ethanolamine ammonia-lyase large subunit